MIISNIVRCIITPNNITNLKNEAIEFNGGIKLYG